MVVDDPLRARYDETPYRDQTFSEFDTARLLGLAEIFGLRSVAAPPADLAVLDLACASGAHLREQAALYPNVRFTGVDFSERSLEHPAYPQAALSHTKHTIQPGFSTSLPAS